VSSTLAYLDHCAARRTRQNGFGAYVASADTFGIIVYNLYSGCLLRYPLSKLTNKSYSHDWQKNPGELGTLALFSLLPRACNRLCRWTPDVHGCGSMAARPDQLHVVCAQFLSTTRPRAFRPSSRLTAGLSQAHV